MSQVAAEYINHVLNLMQQYAYHRTEIDWASVRRGALMQAQGAQTTFDTYPGIFFALTQLHEHHSFLRVPDSLTDDQKETVRKAQYTIYGPYARLVRLPSPSPFHERTEPEGHLLQSDQQTFAWVIIPGCGAKHSNWADNLGDFRDYANKLHTVAADLEAAHPSGWIIDLRGNGGGNMWPMLAGIGFVLGDGKLGSFVSPGGKTDWSYEHGAALVGGKSANAFTLDPPLSLPELPRVAVLIDSGTVSSGEAIAVSFEGRPRTRFFGTHTFGLASSNQTLPLSDGASLFLNNAVDADRRGQEYDNGVEPDVVLPNPSTTPEETTDAALQAALSWLRAAL